MLKFLKAPNSELSGLLLIIMGLMVMACVGYAVQETGPKLDNASLEKARAEKMELATQANKYAQIFREGYMQGSKPAPYSKAANDGSGRIQFNDVSVQEVTTLLQELKSFESAKTVLILFGANTYYRNNCGTK